MGPQGLDGGKKPPAELVSPGLHSTVLASGKCFFLGLGSLICEMSARFL